MEILFEYLGIDKSFCAWVGSLIHYTSMVNFEEPIGESAMGYSAFACLGSLSVEIS